MEIQSPTTSRSSPTADALLARSRRGELRLLIIVSVSVCSLVPLLVAGGLSLGLGIVIAIPAVLVITALVVRWPIVGFFVVLGGTLLVEQDPLPVPLFSNSLKLYVFFWPGALQGLPDRPIGFLMALVLLVFVLQNALKRNKILNGGELLWPFLGFLVCVVWGIVHGLSTGGDLKILVNEVRSFWYLFLGYLLAYNLVTNRKHLRYFFWIIIVCAGLKGLEGTYIYLVVLHGNLTNNHEIMGHEDSYFFVAILLLIILFSLHSKDRPQFYACLIVLPFVFLAMIANQRRTDYIALLVGAVVAWVLIFMVKPQARKGLLRLFLICALLGGGYVAAFYKGSGGFSQPARAVVSVFYTSPSDASDASSNLYRTIEDTDLKYTAKLNLLGLGFGKPFLQPIPLPDLSASDPVYNYIPHNTIYWVLMRLGPIGYLAFWYLFGSIIVRGSIIARQLKDRYLQLMAIFIVSMAIMEIIVAYADYQLSFYRNVIFVGMLAGVLMKLPALDSQEEKSADETARSDAKFPIANLGGRDA